jgi:hypothetical protein
MAEPGAVDSPVVEDPPIPVPKPPPDPLPDEPPASDAPPPAPATSAAAEGAPEPPAQAPQPVPATMPPPQERKKRPSRAKAAPKIGEVAAQSIGGWIAASDREVKLANLRLDRDLSMGQIRKVDPGRVAKLYGDLCLTPPTALARVTVWQVEDDGVSLFASAHVGCAIAQCTLVVLFFVCMDFSLNWPVLSTK